MNFNAIIETLAKAEPTRKEFGDILTCLSKCLAQSNSTLTGNLIEFVSEAGDPIAQNNLNYLLDLYTIEPVEQVTQEWRTFSISTIVKQPKCLVLASCDTYVNIENNLKEFLGLPDDALLKIHPLLVTPSLLIKQGAEFSLNFVNKLKKEIVLACNENNTLKTKFGNICINHEQGQELTESILFFSVKCSHSEAGQILSSLEDIGYSPFKYQYASASVPDIKDPFAVDFYFCDGGAPWRIMSEALHTAELLKVGSWLTELKKVVSSKSSMVLTCLNPIKSNGNFLVKCSFLIDSEIVAVFSEPYITDTSMFYSKIEDLVSSQFSELKIIKINEIFEEADVPENFFYNPFLKKWEAFSEN